MVCFYCQNTECSKYCISSKYIYCGKFFAYAFFAYLIIHDDDDDDDNNNSNNNALIYIYFFLAILYNLFSNNNNNNFYIHLTNVTAITIVICQTFY